MLWRYPRRPCSALHVVGGTGELRPALIFDSLERGRVSGGGELAAAADRTGWGQSSETCACEAWRADEEPRLLDWRERNNQPLMAVELHIRIVGAAGVSFFACHFRAPHFRNGAVMHMARSGVQLIVEKPPPVQTGEAVCVSPLSTLTGRCMTTPLCVAAW
jgi:hypothetical protein